MWLWIISLLLIGFPTIILVSQYVYVIFFHNLERDGSYTFPPPLYGLMIFAGVLILPTELPINRFALATLGLLFDPFVLSLLYLPLRFLRGKHRHTKDD